MKGTVWSMLHKVNQLMVQAEQYEELMDEFDPEKIGQGDYEIEYENYYNRIDRIWQELDEGRELGEGNDEILEAWERVHIKACEVYQQLKPI